MLILLNCDVIDKCVYIRVYENIKVYTLQQLTLCQLYFNKDASKTSRK